ncbi:MAG: response regulator [Alphaproteobacteria bacterium]|nr:response regulator [Alphaproteobacteria bacterium]
MSPKKSPHILVVDDDKEIRLLVARALEREGFRTSLAADGAELFRIMERGAIDLIVLDVMLPGKDGLALCRDLRAKKQQTPIILLTAKGEEIDRIIGLEMGADDYIAKPFNSRELIARVKAVLRRTQQPAPNETRSQPRSVVFDDWKLDLARRELIAKDGVIVSLSTGEFDLLSVFVNHAHVVLSREQLLDLAKGRSSVVFDRSIDIQVSRLRRKLGDDAKDPRIIKTVWGGGYLFTPDVSPA